MDLGPPSFISCAIRLKEGRLVLILFLDRQQLRVGAIDPSVYHIHSQVPALSLVQRRVQVKPPEPLDSPVGGLGERVLNGLHPRARLASVDGLFWDWGFGEEEKPWIGGIYKEVEGDEEDDQDKC